MIEDTELPPELPGIHARLLEAVLVTDLIRWALQDPRNARAQALVAEAVQLLERAEELVNDSWGSTDFAGRHHDDYRPANASPAAEVKLLRTDGQWVLIEVQEPDRPPKWGLVPFIPQN